MPTGSALPLIRLPGFEYPASARLDFRPLQTAITQNIETELKKRQEQRELERLGLERQRVEGDQTHRDREYALSVRRFDADQAYRVGQAERENRRIGVEEGRFRLSQDEAAERERERVRVRLANQAERIRRMEDRTYRSAEAIRFIWDTPNLASTLERHGVRLNRAESTVEDYDRALDFLINETRDPLERREREARIDFMGSRGEARYMDAETRRQRLLLEQYQERLGPTPTREQWERENAPGGIIHTIFGGPQRFEDAPSLYQQVQDRRRRTRLGNDQELLDLGFSEAEVRALRRLEVERSVGLVSPPGPGRSRIFNPQTGRYELRNEGDRDPRNAVSPEQMEIQLRRLDQVFSLLAGTARENGTLDTTHAIPLAERVAGHWWGGQYISPRAYEAFEAGRHAALQLTYALSGRQIGQHEQARILEMYTPRAGDTHEVAGFRINAMRQLYRQLLTTRGRQLSMSERAEFEDQLAYHARTVERLRREAEERRSGPRRTPGAQTPPPDQTTPPPPGNNPQGLPPGWREEGDYWIAPNGVRMRRPSG